MAILQMSESFAEAAHDLPQDARVKLSKIFMLLTKDPRHPSLQVKKIKGAKRNDIYECRLDQSWRIILRDLGEKNYALVHVGAHDDALKLGAAIGLVSIGSFASSLSSVVFDLIYASIAIPTSFFEKLLGFKLSALASHDKKKFFNNSTSKVDAIKKYISGDDSSLIFIPFNSEVFCISENK